MRGFLGGETKVAEDIPRDPVTLAFIVHHAFWQSSHGAFQSVADFGFLPGRSLPAVSGRSLLEGVHDEDPLGEAVLLTFNATRYTFESMILAFLDKEAEAIFHRRFSRRLPADIQPVALRKLRMLHNAQSLADLRIPPANRLEKLSGDREGRHSIRVNDQWRICFVWREKNADEVEIVDYHRRR